ncbi:MAG: glycine cleavage system protein H [Anaerolineae bacterium]
MTVTATYHIPDDRYYDGERHLWARFEPETGRVVVGIDALGLAALGDLAYISLEAVGTQVERGQSIGVLEAAKMTDDLIAPVGGRLAARNEAVLRDPSLVNSDPYGQGWIVALEASDWEGESAELVSGPALPDWIAAEIERYRDQGWID